MFKPRVACDPVEGVVQPSLAFAVVKFSYIGLLTTCPYFDNLEVDIFDACRLQCQFLTSVTTYHCS